ECMLLYQMAGIGSATSGSQSGYEALKWVILIFIFCLVAYSVIGLKKLGKQKTQRVNGIK
ncbi:MAG TPA: hypothetical protein VFF11_05020, partial [Candidatus Binatia bacterium]|nr:hypothetical protein [Candidatus Binatia bacterium]